MEAPVSYLSFFVSSSLGGRPIKTGYRWNNIGLSCLLLFKRDTNRKRPWNDLELDINYTSGQHTNNFLLSNPSNNDYRGTYRYSARLFALCHAAAQRGSAELFTLPTRPLTRAVGEHHTASLNIRVPWIPSLIAWHQVVACAVVRSAAGVLATILTSRAHPIGCPLWGEQIFRVMQDNVAGPHRSRHLHTRCSESKMAREGITYTAA
jgi:hypothetical protein